MLWTTQFKFCCFQICSSLAKTDGLFVSKKKATFLLFKLYIVRPGNHFFMQSGQGICLLFLNTKGVDVMTDAII